MSLKLMIPLSVLIVLYQGDRKAPIPFSPYGASVESH